jgi:hypothetical protein
MATASKHKIEISPERIEVIPAVVETSYLLELNQKEAETLLHLVGMISGTSDARTATSAIYYALDAAGVFDEPYHRSPYTKKARALAGIMFNYHDVGL